MQPDTLPEPQEEYAPLTEAEEIAIAWFDHIIQTAYSDDLPF